MFLSCARVGVYVYRFMKLLDTEKIRANEKNAKVLALKLQLARTKRQLEESVPYIRAYTFSCMHAYIHTYIHIYIHTCIIICNDCVCIIQNRPKTKSTQRTCQVSEETEDDTSYNLFAVRNERASPLIEVTV